MKNLSFSQREECLIDRLKNPEREFDNVPGFSYSSTSSFNFCLMKLSFLIQTHFTRAQTPKHQSCFKEEIYINT